MKNYLNYQLGLSKNTIDLKIILYQVTYEIEPALSNFSLPSSLPPLIQSHNMIFYIQGPILWSEIQFDSPNVTHTPLKVCM